MQRGAFVTAVVAGDDGKPRPALVIQSDLLADLPSLIVRPLTTTLRPDGDFIRISVEPSRADGLRQPRQVAIDKIVSVPVGKIGAEIGLADDALMLRVSRALAVLLGIA